MEAKFTKGEWLQSHRLKANGMYSTEVYDEQGETICTLAWHKVPIDKGYSTDREANAKLIAAAPDLFEALRRFISFVDKQKLGYESSMILQAKAAIKKATE